MDCHHAYCTEQEQLSRGYAGFSLYVARNFLVMVTTALETSKNVAM